MSKAEFEVHKQSDIWCGYTGTFSTKGLKVKEFNSWADFMGFITKVTSSHRFIHDDETVEFFGAILNTSKSRETLIHGGEKLWRAQYDCNTSGYDEQPYPSDRMKPLFGKAREGRANPKGIPVLYLASEYGTAIAEMRPWVGAKYSVGEFVVLRDLRLINLSNDTSIRYYSTEPAPEEREKAVWSDINRSFSMPVTNDDLTSYYVPTQIIAELFKHYGFDGIVYKSNYGKGFNIALFDIGSVDILKNDLCKITNFEFNYEIENRLIFKR